MWVFFLTMIGTEFMCYLFFGRGGEVRTSGVIIVTR